MKKNNLFLLIVAIFAMVSCNTKRRAATTDTMYVSKPNIIAIPQVADLNIDTRQIEGVAEVRKKDYGPHARKVCISLAIKNAVVKGGCDAIVQPVYDLEETRKLIRVKVTGFAATYKKFRPAELSDTTAFVVYSKLGTINNSEIGIPVVTPASLEMYPQPKAKRGIGLIVLGTILGVTLLVSALSL